jgi:branched-chain amino acid transport system ATP-binding protein
MTDLFRAEGLSVSYGGARALRDATVRVGEGELVGLIGPNGAGKTTFIDACCGFVSANGRVLLDEEDLTSLPPFRRARRGIARTWQSGELFNDLSVRENLLVATPARRASTSGDGRGGTDADRIANALERVGLADVEDRTAGELSTGQRKLVGVARALAGSPRLVFLDEPAAGLDTHESIALGQRLRSIADNGVGLLLVDHDMGLVLSTCDTVVVLDFGRVIARGTPQQIRDSDVVVAAYLGVAPPAPKISAPATEAAHD